MAGSFERVWRLSPEAGAEGNGARIVRMVGCRADEARRQSRVAASRPGPRPGAKLPPGGASGGGGVPGRDAAAAVTEPAARAPTDSSAAPSFLLGE